MKEGPPMYKMSFNNLSLFVIYSQKIHGDMSFQEGGNNCRKFCKSFFNFPIVSADQVHGNKIEIVDSSFSGQAQIPEADALITREMNLGLANRMGDCPIVTLIDPIAKIMANVHSGREGIRQRITPETVNLMTMEDKQKQLQGAIRDNIHVVVGPCICKNCYTVAEEKADHWGFLGDYKKFVYPVRENPDLCRVDLRGIIEYQLIEEAGIKKENIRHMRSCTYEDMNYFSYRRAMANGKNNSDSRQREKHWYRGICVAAMKTA